MHACMYLKVRRSTPLVVVKCRETYRFSVFLVSVGGVSVQGWHLSTPKPYII